MTRKILRGCYRKLRPRVLRNALSLSLTGIETGIVPEVRDLPPGQQVLVLAPHADDETIGCGGSISKLRAQGIAVKVLFISDGSLGDSRIRELSDRDPKKIASRQTMVLQRRAEAEAAMARLSVNEFDFLDLPDGELDQHSQQLQRSLLDAIQCWRADAVYLPFISDRHLDHQAVAVAAIEALVQAPVAVRSGVTLCAYEVWSPLYPNLVIDISEHIADKREAMQKYASQLAGTDYQNAILGLNQYRSIAGLKGKGYAEAFYYGQVELFRELLQEVRR